jgi:hypothetical protein
MKRFGIVATTVALAIFATTAVASAQLGVAVMWQGGGVAPIYALPIQMGEAMVIQPMAAFAWVAEDGGAIAGSAYMLGGSLEAHFGDGDAKGLVGGKLFVEFGSPKGEDTWTDFQVGIFLGGTAKLADNLSLVGQWGPTLTMVGKRSLFDKSYIAESSDASITLRWWVFGSK